MIEFIEAYADSPGERQALREYVERALDYRRRHSGKECPKCNETKPLSAFGADSKEKDGLRHVCNACRRASRWKDGR